MQSPLLKTVITLYHRKIVTQNPKLNFPAQNIAFHAFKTGKTNAPNKKEASIGNF